MNITLSWVSAGVIGAHGVGHILGWLPAWRLASFDQVSSTSWLLDPILGQRVSHGIAGALYLAPTLGFVAAALALATGQAWWKEVAVASALASMLASALYPAALPTGSLVGSTAINAVILGMAIWSQPMLDQLAHR